MLWHIPNIVDTTQDTSGATHAQDAFEQRGFARTIRADEREGRAGGHGEVDVFQNGGGIVAQVEVFGD